MKKIALSLATFLVTSSAFPALPNKIDDFQVSAPLFKGGFELGVTVFYLLPVLPELDYAAVFSSAFPTKIDGEVESTHPHNAFTYQVYAGYQFPCSGNDVRLAYSNLYENDIAHVIPKDGFIVALVDPTTLNVPAVVGDVTIGGSTASGVTLIPAASFPVNPTVIAARASNSLRNSFVDLEVSQYLNVDNYVQWRWYGGLRTATIRQKFDVFYDYDNTIVEADIVTIPSLEAFAATALTLESEFGQAFHYTSKFSGIGPRLGMEGSFNISGHFGLVANLAVGVLVGDIEGTASQTFSGDLVFRVTDVDFATSPPDGTVTGLNLPVGTIIPVATLNNISLSDPNVIRLVPNFEGRIGLNYTFTFSTTCRTVNVELGYYVNHYFNAVDRAAITNVPTLESPSFMDASFAGPYLTVAVTL